MNSTKTAVIIGIVILVGVGALIYANRDKFASKTTPSEEAPAA